MKSMDVWSSNELVRPNYFSGYLDMKERNGRQATFMKESYSYN